MLTFLEFHEHNIWNHHEKCIQISTNTPSIGSLIREIDVTFQKCEKAEILWLIVKPMPAV